MTTLDNIKRILEDNYALSIEKIKELSIGSDPNSKVYEIIDRNETSYFLKARIGEEQNVGTLVLAALHSQGIEHVIAPLQTRNGEVGVRKEDVSYYLFPFIESKDAYEIELSDSQWTELGEVLRRIQSVQLPDVLVELLPKEDFRSRNVEIVKKYDDCFMTEQFVNKLAARLAVFWREHRRYILQLVENTERASERLVRQDHEFVLCHSDLHPGNIVVSTEGNLFLVDWDTPILAPKERDLMFIGGGHRFRNENSEAFYQGYGQTEVNISALTYYRNERILADIAVDTMQILEQEGSLEDREQAYYFLTRQFEPWREVEVALKVFS
ncbi:aminoglycoside phosphotransferase family protein [Paenisporosarcina cavernae]|uniref:Aminoglycoside phosphotransferase family protein n=1 Tax=Paenisporosarcina cavernae TaxID=2320858 RepID=A0A385YW84_9BACL|nr:aminoglycoside phosphotransferase family protein [Paenisporosarcina cavernae]AYC30550.1 aminoglycoside phosphotransferase family protein [Paenisporosarcina cavernae]